MKNKFPILNSTEYIPIDAIEPHENQALKNHGQTLKRLAERGGLSWIEALCILEDREYDYSISEIDAKVKVVKIIETISVERVQRSMVHELKTESKYFDAECNVRITYILGREEDEKKYIPEGYVILGIGKVR